MAAISHHAMAIQFASRVLKNDPDVVKFAVSKDGLLLQCASETLKSDPEIMQAALASNPKRCIGLKLTLLSGKCCHHIFKVSSRWAFVLRECASLFGLDRKLAQSAQIVKGPSVISDLAELEPGQLHEVSLVFGSSRSSHAEPDSD